MTQLRVRMSLRMPSPLLGIGNHWDIEERKTHRFRKAGTRANNVKRSEGGKGSLESSIELSPVGDIGLLEDSLGSGCVFFQCLSFGAQSEVGDNYIAAGFQEAERESKRDATATAGDQRGLAFEIAEKHCWCEMRQLMCWELNYAEMTGKEREANLCTRLTSCGIQLPGLSNGPSRVGVLLS